LGCQFVSSVTGQPTWSQSWTSGTSIKSNTFIYAYVCEDPDQLFQVAVVTGTTVVSTSTGLTYTNVNNNVALVANTLNTTTGDSQQAILLSSADVTATLPLRIVDLVPDTAFVVSGTTYYPEAFVKFKAPNVTGSVVDGGHAYYNPTGL
jgi:PPE-repeat protein